MSPPTGFLLRMPVQLLAPEPVTSGVSPDREKLLPRGANISARGPALPAPQKIDSIACPEPATKLSMAAWILASNSAPGTAMQCIEYVRVNVLYVEYATLA